MAYRIAFFVVAILSIANGSPVGDLFERDACSAATPAGENCTLGLNPDPSTNLPSEILGPGFDVPNLVPPVIVPSSSSEIPSSSSPPVLVVPPLPHSDPVPKYHLFFNNNNVELDPDVDLYFDFKHSRLLQFLFYVDDIYNVHHATIVKRLIHGKFQQTFLPWPLNELHE
ncbi:MAG: hypothetical protein M1833_000927 [Piccolia ochrophora]|nr:MAG: hypothetical protein M1833_000927 [Piccolia ochrophora]